MCKTTQKNKTKKLVKYIQLFEVLLSFELPDVYRHFQSIGLQPEHYLIDWLLTAYVKALNFETCCRVWDCFIIEGEGFLFEFSWAIFRHLAPQLLKSNFEEALGKLNNIYSLPPNVFFSQFDRSDSQINVNTFLHDIALKMGNEMEQTQSSKDQVQTLIFGQINSHHSHDDQPEEGNKTKTIQQDSDLNLNLNPNLNPNPLCVDHQGDADQITEPSLSSLQQHQHQHHNQNLDLDQQRQDQDQDRDRDQSPDSSREVGKDVSQLQSPQSSLTKAEYL